tara:strand:+ start:2651 stop:2839 length:189 start_codon:yes stop_codon:yes gene_type:complete
MLDFFHQLKKQPKMPKSSVMSWIQNEKNLNKKHSSSWKNAHLSVIRDKSKGIRPNKNISFAR